MNKDALSFEELRIINHNLERENSLQQRRIKELEECIKDLVTACNFDYIMCPELVKEKHKELINEILEVRSE